MISYKSNSLIDLNQDGESKEMAPTNTARWKMAGAPSDEEADGLAIRTPPAFALFVGVQKA